MTPDDIKFWRGIIDALRTEYREATITADKPDGKNFRIVFESDTLSGVHRWGIGERPTVDEVRGGLGLRSTPPDEVSPATILDTPEKAAARKSIFSRLHAALGFKEQN